MLNSKDLIKKKMTYVNNRTFDVYVKKIDYEKLVDNNNAFISCYDKYGTYKHMALIKNIID